MSTRLFTLEVSDSKKQIDAALATQAALETQGRTLPDRALIAFQTYLQLRAPWRTIVPFASGLSKAISKGASAPRILRDFARLLALVKAVAVLRHHHRQVDSTGRIVADLTDYVTVRDLVNDLYIDTSSGATSAIRELVDAVKDIGSAPAEDGVTVRITAKRLADHLGINKMTALRRAGKARRAGWVINREDKKGYPADYILGDPMPVSEGLPTVEEVEELDAEGGNTVTPSTDGSIDPHPSDEIPDCPKCGGNEWTFGPDGSTLVCPCGEERTRS